MTLATLLLAPWDLPGNLRLADPAWLAAWFVLPLALWARNRQKTTVWVVPYVSSWVRSSLVNWSRWPILLATLGYVLTVFALARPQRVEDKREVHSKGYDIVLAIDLSSSMLIEDYEKNGDYINRLQAVKPVLQDFIGKRPDDRIGLVVFSGRAYTLAPLTFDHDWLLRQTERLKIGMIEDGTAIGDGLGVALTRLEQQDRIENGSRKGAFIVLLTDGANNRGALSPEQAAQIAKSRGIPIYAVGAGTSGIVRMPVFDAQGHKIGYERVRSDLDEEPLRRVATDTGGHFFRADDVRTTERAFAEISRSQKIEFQAQSYYETTELFAYTGGPGALLLLLAAALANGLPSFRAPRMKGATP